MDAEMIEKVARAIYVSARGLGIEWDELAPYAKWNYRDYAVAAIAALSATPQAAQVPAGYALVPVIATKEMARAFGRNEYVGFSEAYTAMLAAAQAQGCAMGTALANYESIAEAHYRREAAQAQEPNT